MKMALLGVLLAGYQNCTPARTSSSESASTPQMAGNGTGYDGKPTTYNRYDLNNACTEKDRAGKPLPNDVVFFRSGADIVIIRDGCTDVSPRAVAPSEISVIDDTHIQFRSTTFDKFTPDAFAIAAAACPAGWTAIPGALRINMVESPLDLLAMPPWGYMPEIATYLSSAFAGLPAFQIVRTAAAPSDWQRLDQSVDFQPNRQYAVSFMARPNTSNEVRFLMFKSGIESGAAWSLQTGALLESWNSGELTAVSTASRPIPGGFFYTLYFTTPANITSLDIGLSSNTLNQGDSIDATAVQVEDVSTICSP